MNVFDKAYKVGRETFKREGKVNTVSVEAEGLIRENYKVPMLKILDAYYGGIIDESNAQADAELLAGGNFTEEELKSFPSYSIRVENEKKYNYEEAA